MLCVEEYFLVLQSDCVFIYLFNFFVCELEGLGGLLGPLPSRFISYLKSVGTPGLQGVSFLGHWALPFWDRPDLRGFLQILPSLQRAPPPSFCPGFWPILFLLIGKNEPWERSCCLAQTSPLRDLPQPWASTQPVLCMLSVCTGHQQASFILFNSKIKLSTQRESFCSSLFQYFIFIPHSKQMLLGCLSLSMIEMIVLDSVLKSVFPIH